jgi:uncharacterized membrane protein YccC
MAQEQPELIGRDRHQLAADAMECTLLATHVPFDTSHWREATGTVQALLRRMLLVLPMLSGLADRRQALGSAHGEWQDLLHESLALRDAQAKALLAECDGLLAHLEDPRKPSPAPLPARARIVLHADARFALLSGASAAIASLIGCTLWITTGWADGAVAVALTGVFCCLFAGMDNPVPTILRFGLAVLAGIPMAALYLFVLLPGVGNGFTALAVLLAIPLVIVGMLGLHPRWGIAVLACAIGFCSALAIQESFAPDFARFLNSNLAQVVAVVLAAGVTAGLRQIGINVAIARLVRRMRRELADIAAGTTPPDTATILSRGIDRGIALLHRPAARSGERSCRRSRRSPLHEPCDHSAIACGCRTFAARVDGGAGRRRRCGSDERTGAPPPAPLIEAIDRALALTLIVTPPEAQSFAQLLVARPRNGAARSGRTAAQSLSAWTRFCGAAVGMTPNMPLAGCISPQPRLRPAPLC